MRTSPKDSKRGHDLLTNLPSEITIDILSRLPLRSIMTCKCVHKSLRNLIETPDFAKSYKSCPPCLAVSEGGFRTSNAIKFRVFDYENDCINQAFNSFSLPHLAPLHSSVDGFVLLFDYSRFPACHELIICNPTTRDYIKIPSPYFSMKPWHTTTGFGVSKISCRYKIVRIYNFQERRLKGSCCCQVYTLGRGRLWRSTVLTGSALLWEFNNTVGVFSKGNIHWLGRDSNGFPWISCFDLETELFTTPLSLPPRLKDSLEMSSTLSGDGLVICDNSSRTEIVMWLMKDYGDDKSWTKQYVISKDEIFRWNEHIYVNKLKDGDILIRRGSSNILCYSNKTAIIIRKTAVIESPSHSWTRAVWFTPSFLSLKTLFPMENASSF